MLRLAALFLCSLMLSPTPSSAQTLRDPQPGDVLFIHDVWSAVLDLPQYHDACFESIVGLELDVQVFAPSQGATGVEFDVLVPDGYFVLSRTILVENAVDLSEEGDEHWQLRFDSCFETEEWVPVISYELASFLPSTIEICITGPDAGRPTWIDCDGSPQPGSLWPPDYEVYNEGCAIINPTGFCPVEAARANWGAIKARY